MWEDAARLDSFAEGGVYSQVQRQAARSTSWQNIARHTLIADLWQFAQPDPGLEHGSIVLGISCEVHVYSKYIAVSRDECLC